MTITELDVGYELHGFDFLKVDDFIFKHDGKERYCLSKLFHSLDDLFDYLSSYKLAIYQFKEVTGYKPYTCYILRRCEL